MPHRPPPNTLASKPLHLAMLADEPESIYPTPNVERPREEEGINAGGVNFHLTFNYLTDYVYRGIDHSEVGNASEDAPNLQFDGYLEFNLGRLPHPVVGVFVNVFNDDPISRFQEIRPYLGFDWNLRPLTISAGWISYIFPEREGQNTQEIYGRLTLDDAYFFHSNQPLLTPYLYAAYDYQKYDGVYLEAGVKHDFPVPDTGIVLTAVADVGYALNRPLLHPQQGRGQRLPALRHRPDRHLLGQHPVQPAAALRGMEAQGLPVLHGRHQQQPPRGHAVVGGMGISFDY